MSRLRRALAVLAITSGALLVAGPAAAGGPTSVLLVVPDAGRTASLYVDDADYQTLADIVGAYGTTAPGPLASAGSDGAGHDAGRSVTVTWLIHDVLVWRVDRIYLGEGSAWIATQENHEGSGTIWDRPVSWHPTARGAELAALLDRLGVGPGSGSRGSGGVPAPTVDTRTTADTATRSSPRELPWVLAGLPWALAGMTLGVLITLGGGFALRWWRGSSGRRSPEAGPDAEPDADSQAEVLVL